MARPRALARLVPAGHEPHIHLTITDDGGMAQAFVIIEALPVIDAPGGIGLTTAPAWGVHGNEQ